jgi:hypothetical protein
MSFKATLALTGAKYASPLVVATALAVAATTFTPQVASACSGFCSAGVNMFHSKFPVYSRPNPAPAGRPKVCCRPTLR